MHIKLLAIKTLILLATTGLVLWYFILDTIFTEEIDLHNNHSFTILFLKHFIWQLSRQLTRQHYRNSTLTIPTADYQILKYTFINSFLKGIHTHGRTKFPTGSVCQMHGLCIIQVKFQACLQFWIDNPKCDICLLFASDYL